MNCKLEKIQTCEHHQCRTAWWCKDCDPKKQRLLKGNYKRKCLTGNHSQSIDAATWFTTRHNQIPPQNDVLDLPSLLKKLERCRASGCTNLINDICQTRGASCKAREFWFTKLMLGDCERWGPPDNRIRVGFITHGLMMGGAERWIVDMATHLDKTIFNVVGIGIIEQNKTIPSLLSLAEKTTKIYQGKENTAKLLNIADILIYWSSNLVEKLGETQAIEVFVAHGLPWSEYAWTPPNNSKIHRVAVSQWAAQTFQSLPTTVIHNGVVASRLIPQITRDEIRKVWGLAPDDIAIGYIGRRSPEKAPYAAALAAATKGPPYRAVYVGGGMPQITQAIREFPGSPIVLPAIEHVGDIYAGLDCFMLASKTEGFSLAMIEAWMCGVPVVATPVGSVPELEIEYGPLVVRVPVEATGEQLVSAVNYAISEDNREVVELARKVAYEHFTVEAMADRWSKYLQGIVS